MYELPVADRCDELETELAEVQAEIKTLHTSILDIQGSVKNLVSFCMSMLSASGIKELKERVDQLELNDKDVEAVILDLQRRVLRLELNTKDNEVLAQERYQDLRERITWTRI